MARNSERPAFTLLELVVVIAIFGVLLALIIPAAQRVRQTAAKTRCQNNLRQIGLAIQGHEANYGVIPSNGGYPVTSLTANGGGTFVPTLLDYQVGGKMLLAAGDPTKNPWQQPGSYAYAILPFLEEEAAFRERAWTHGISVFACPSRRSAAAQAVHDDGYGAYEGGGWVWGKTDYAANRKVILGLPRPVPFSFISDGLSNTILVGEKAMSPLNYTSGTWYYDAPFFFGNHEGVFRQVGQVIRDAPGCPFQDRWGAAHLGGAQFLFADGSVRTLAFTPNAGFGRPEDPVVLALMTPNGGEVVSYSDQ
jgi:prepilin-type N-terminal cleavage/methylation domain-containing protein/prepilin-type processing-associated H-X9-DG protein